MTFTKGRSAAVTLAAVTGVGCLFVSEKPSLQKSSVFDTQANAIIGRPLTPMSYAGVARRTTRRAVYGTAAVYGAPVYAAPVVVTPACVQSVDP